MPDPRQPKRHRVDVVIVSYNTRVLTLEAIESVQGSLDVDVRVWVVDNASTDGSADAIRARCPGVRLVRSERNVGFGRANNLALDQVDAPWVLLFNSDARFADAHGLHRLVERLRARSTVGVVGPRLEDGSGRLEYSARPLPSITAELARGTGLHHLLPRAVRARRLAYEFRDHAVAGPADWLTGACLLVRSQVVEDVGGFDPAIFLYGEELEWCWRVRKAGWEIALEPEVTVIHRRGASGSAPGDWRSRLAMAGDAYTVRKHRGWAYLAVFAAARCVGLGFEAVLQGALGLGPGGQTRHLRSTSAVRSLRAWLSALAAGGASNPSAARLLPGPPAGAGG